MKLDWNAYLNFPEDIENGFTPFFTENLEGFEDAEGSESTKNIENIRNRLENIVLPSNTNSFIELEVKPIESFTSNTNNSDCSTYQYNLCIGDNFDDWESVDRFMHKYCLERGFGYQVSRNDKDFDNPAITRRKLFRCSSSGNYKLVRNLII